MEQQEFSQKQHQELNQLIQFLHSDQPLMLIIGEQGSGKTDVLTLLVNQIRQTHLLTRLHGSHLIQPKNFIHTLTRQWHTPSHSHKSPLTWQLHHICDSLTQASEPSILIIDDAHLLSYEVLAIVICLSVFLENRTGPLKILLSGQPRLLPQIKKLHPKSIPQMTIGALSYQIAYQKIKEYLRLAHLDVMDAEPVVQRIYQKSKGLPDTIKSLTQQFISKQQSTTTKVIPTGTLLKNFFHYGEILWRRHRGKTLSWISLLILGICLTLFNQKKWQPNETPVQVQLPEPTVTTPQHH